MEAVRGYPPLLEKGYSQKAVRHSRRQYVGGMEHTRGIEPIWAAVKRSCYGIYHHMSHESLHRHSEKFQHHYNVRPLDTVDQMAKTVKDLVHKRLTYAYPIENGVHAKRRMETAA